MEEIIQFFLDLLQVTVGGLAPGKCAWFLIPFRWKEGKASVIIPSETHIGIELISQSTGTQTTIKRKAPSESHRTLGFHLNGDGTSTGHKQVMMYKIILYSEAVDSITLSKSESRLAYNAFYMKSIGYGTPTTSLSYQEYDDMQKPIVTSILPKIGINRKASRAVVFGTAQHGGLGLDHLATVQLYGQLQCLLGSIRCNDTTGQLARMMIEFVELECGCTGNVLEQDYERYHGTIIDKNWITEICSHLQLYDAKIQINGLWTPQPGREGDI
jgi:hypothetical protein